MVYNYRDCGALNIGEHLQGTFRFGPVTKLVEEEKDAIVVAVEATNYCKANYAGDIKTVMSGSVERIELYGGVVVLTDIHLTETMYKGLAADLNEQGRIDR